MTIETSLINELEALRMGGDLFSDMARELNKVLNFEAGAKWADEHPSIEGLIEKQPLTAAEMIDELKKYPSDALVVIEYCHPRLMKYDKERNLIKID